MVIFCRVSGWLAMVCEWQSFSGSLRATETDWETCSWHQNLVKLFHTLGRTGCHIRRSHQPAGHVKLASMDLEWYPLQMTTMWASPTESYDTCYKHCSIICHPKTDHQRSNGGLVDIRSFSRSASSQSGHWAVGDGPPPGESKTRVAFWHAPGASTDSAVWQQLGMSDTPWAQSSWRWLKDLNIFHRYSHPLFEFLRWFDDVLVVEMVQFSQSTGWIY